MKEAPCTFDGQLSPVCSWCELAVCQVWCNEVHGEEQGTQELQEQHTAHSRSTIADVLLKESWVAGYFFWL